MQAASHVDTVVFDKTGTLTSGKPTVVAVRPLTLSAAEHQPEQQGQQQQHGSWQQQHSRHTHSSSRSSSSGGVPAAYGASELLGLAAAVERGSTHPIAKAILKAADAATVQQQQQKEGPGTNGAKSHGSFAAAVPGSFVQVSSRPHGGVVNQPGSLRKERRLQRLPQPSLGLGLSYACRAGVRQCVSHHRRLPDASCQLLQLPQPPVSSSI